MRTGLSYDDVCLIPKCNNIDSRRDPMLGTKLTKNTYMSIPIVAANMDTVIGPELTRVLDNNDSIPIWHRFYDQNTTPELIDMVKKYDGFMSIGVGDSAKMILEMHKAMDLRPVGYCVDIAHGHSHSVFEIIEYIKKVQPFAEVIAGNVCTARAVHDLANAGADAVKVGIGPGSVCTTRNVTAFGRAQFSAVLECSEIGKELQIPIIADGGIKGSREIILALAAGASSVMIGGLFARTEEAAGKGQFRGQASAEFQQAFYGEIKQGTVPEGVARTVEITGSAQELIDGLAGGLRSGMTYGGAMTIDELQRKAEFEIITPNYF